MKLSAFQIKNYRSIIDSGLKYLANDNVTALIGQNESGKTSVLEALKSFYDDKIHEDILRSDLSLPEISCFFELRDTKIIDILNKKRLPEELIKYLSDCNELMLTRSWINESTSKVFISNEPVLKYYKEIENKQTKLLEQTQKEIEELLKEAERSFNEIEQEESHKSDLQAELNNKRKQSEEAKKVFNKSKRSDEKIIAEQNYETALKLYQDLEEEFKDVVKNLENKKIKAQQISEKASVCRTYRQVKTEKEKKDKLLIELKQNLAKTKQLFDITSSEKDKKQFALAIDNIKGETGETEAECIKLEEEVELNQMIATHVLAGMKYREAQIKAKSEYKEQKEKYNLYSLGSDLFKHIPIFEFFEDFSSLLPNRIDLEDVLNENSQTEGYKAARNFLIIAGLNEAFFREQNQRILKQKIENLNGEITINFQDYWSQDVGKNNKICLHFELEHYDYTVAEKSGKPYLEFWIKDKQERLYPKQRSRGVRWFLSFYMELKATAKMNTVNRVLLIDEPGLSLHARAQEDVLKVFEDLKEDMQIIYCTHSPHLVDINKLYRIIAIQRADEEDENSETVVLDAKSLHSASTDTLSPIYSLMGIRLNEQHFIHPKNNIIVEDTITYYYLSTLAKIKKIADIYFLPASGMSNIPSLANILMGWKLDYKVLLFDNKAAHNVVEELKKTIFIGEKLNIDNSLIIIPGITSIEDLFSTIDFKSNVLQERVGITEKNSEYINTNGISRTILASNFINHMEEKKKKFEDFDDETRQNFNKVFESIHNFLKDN